MKPVPCAPHYSAMEGKNKRFRPGLQENPRATQNTGGTPMPHTFRSHLDGAYDFQNANYAALSGRNKLVCSLPWVLPRAESCAGPSGQKNADLVRVVILPRKVATVSQQFPERVRRCRASPMLFYSFLSIVKQDTSQLGNRPLPIEFHDGKSPPPHSGGGASDRKITLPASNRRDISG